MNKWLFLFTILISGSLLIPKAWAHCEIPCGIYDDQARVEMMLEHITTIEKSMKQIKELSKGKPINYNQLVRWVNNKEMHADNLQEIVTQYFLTQRINPSMDAGSYTTMLKQLHQILLLGMKTKQEVNLALIQDLRKEVHAFSHTYEKTTAKKK